MNDPLTQTMTSSINASSSSLDRAEQYIAQAIEILNKLGI